MRILGIDTSLTGTGLARLDLHPAGPGAVDTAYSMVVCTVRAPGPGKDKSKRAMARRVRALIDQVDEAFEVERPDRVGIEGLAYSAGNASAWVLAWVWGEVIALCERYNVPLTVVAPTARVKFAMGKGSGPGTDKDHVLARAISLFPEADITGNNEADAAIVAAVVAQQQGYPILPVTKARAEVMAKLGD